MRYVGRLHRRLRFSDFEKKSDCFAVYNYHEIILLPPPLSPEPPARGFCQCAVRVRCEPSLSIRRFWGKRERWKRKRERAEGEKRLTQMLLLEPSTPTQHDSSC